MPMPKYEWRWPTREAWLQYKNQFNKPTPPEPGPTGRILMHAIEAATENADFAALRHIDIMLSDAEPSDVFWEAYPPHDVPLAAWIRYHTRLYTKYYGLKMRALDHRFAPRDRLTLSPGEQQFVDDWDNSADLLGRLTDVIFDLGSMDYLERLLDSGDLPWLAVRSPPPHLYDDAYKINYPLAEKLIKRGAILTNSLDARLNDSTNPINFLSYSASILAQFAQNFDIPYGSHILCEEKKKTKHIDAAMIKARAIERENRVRLLEQVLEYLPPPPYENYGPKREPIETAVGVSEQQDDFYQDALVAVPQPIESAPSVRLECACCIKIQKTDSPNGPYLETVMNHLVTSMNVGLIAMGLKRGLCTDVHGVGPHNSLSCPDVQSHWFAGTWTPIGILCHVWRFGTHRDALTILDMLVEYGARPDAVNYDGTHPLAQFCLNGAAFYPQSPRAIGINSKRADSAASIAGLSEEGTAASAEFFRALMSRGALPHAPPNVFDFRLGKPEPPGGRKEPRSQGIIDRQIALDACPPDFASCFFRRGMGTLARKVLCLSALTVCLMNSRLDLVEDMLRQFRPDLMDMHAPPLEGPERERALAHVQFTDVDIALYCRHPCADPVVVRKAFYDLEENGLFCAHPVIIYSDSSVHTEIWDNGKGVGVFEYCLSRAHSSMYIRMRDGFVHRYDTSDWGRYQKHEREESSRDRRKSCLSPLEESAELGSVAVFITVFEEYLRKWGENVRQLYSSSTSTSTTTTPTPTPGTGKWVPPDVAAEMLSLALLADVSMPSLVKVASGEERHDKILYVMDRVITFAQEQWTPYYSTRWGKSFVLQETVPAAWASMPSDVVQFLETCLVHRVFARNCSQEAVGATTVLPDVGGVLASLPSMRKYFAPFIHEHNSSIASPRRKQGEEMGVCSLWADRICEYIELLNRKLPGFLDFSLGCAAGEFKGSGGRWQSLWGAYDLYLPTTDEEKDLVPDVLPDIAAFVDPTIWTSSSSSECGDGGGDGSSSSSSNGAAAVSGQIDITRAVRRTNLLEAGRIIFGVHSTRCSAVFSGSFLRHYISSGHRLFFSPVTYGNGHAYGADTRDGVRMELLLQKGWGLFAYVHPIETGTNAYVHTPRDLYFTERLTRILVRHAPILLESKAGGTSMCAEMIDAMCSSLNVRTVFWLHRLVPELIRPHLSHSIIASMIARELGSATGSSIAPVIVQLYFDFMGPEADINRIFCAAPSDQLKKFAAFTGCRKAFDKPNPHWSCPSCGNSGASAAAEQSERLCYNRDLLALLISSHCDQKCELSMALVNIGRQYPDLPPGHPDAPRWPSLYNLSYRHDVFPELAKHGFDPQHINPAKINAYNLDSWLGAAKLYEAREERGITMYFAPGGREVVC